MRTRGWLFFAVLWISVVFLPVSYWILNESDGWAAGMLVADLGGGAFVHIVAGAAALALLLVLGRQRAGIQQSVSEAPVCNSAVCDSCGPAPPSSGRCCCGSGGWASTSLRKASWTR